ncbi:MAG: NUDIX domain-containing protein [Planctomycetota bacterium]
MTKEPIPTWCFALVVVRRGDQFLMVQERGHGQRWYLPAGRLEQGETFVAGAERETLEEAGIPIRVTGILRIEHSPRTSGARLRVIFLGEPADQTPLKSVPDDESLGAAWVRLDQLHDFPLRGEEVRELFTYVQTGGTIFPPKLLQFEGYPYF